MAGSITKSIANTSTTDVEKYSQKNHIINKRNNFSKVKIMAKNWFLTTGIQYVHILYFYLTTKQSDIPKQKNVLYTLHSIRDLINKEKYQDAEKSIKKMLKEHCSISYKDDQGNNLLHYIALLSGEKKFKYAELAVKTSPKEQLAEAINSKNREDYTPIKTALVNKVQKVKFSQGNNTADFCILLLRNGATDPEDQLTLPKRFHNELYYRIVKKIRGETGTYPNIETWKKLQMKFSRENQPTFGLDGIVIGLICATGFTALGGNMMTAAHLSITIALCIAFSLIYNALTHDKQNSIEKKPDQEKGPSTLLNIVNAASLVMPTIHI